LFDWIGDLINAIVQAISDGFSAIGTAISNAIWNTMIQWFYDTGCPVLVVANKLDKLKKSEIEPNLAQIRAVLGLAAEAVLIPFSAEKGTGKEELLRHLQEQFQ